MTQLAALKSATTLHNVADLLGFRAQTLAFILYKLDDARKYKEFDIPKRHGGTRSISAPLPELKLLQRRLSFLLQNCIEEIGTYTARQDTISHGFTRRRSIVSNARRHRNRRYVFNIDLLDFFGAINFGRVRGFFLSDRNFMLHKTVATILAQIACHKNALPQGSPCSPVISNLIGHILDIHLVRLASNSGCTYSRYADDITFSTNEPHFPRCIAEHTDVNKDKWAVGETLARIIERCGFQINDVKTRMQYHDSRQEVTGLIVNEKINVRSEYRHTVRAMANSLFTTGRFHLSGGTKCDTQTSVTNAIPGTIHQLYGMVSFIYNIDTQNTKRRHIHKGLSQYKAHDEQPKRRSEYLYFQVVLFKHFYMAAMPVIICEGKTDSVYISCAIRRLAESYRLLATSDGDGNVEMKVRFFRYAETTIGKLLDMGSGGAGILAKFIRRYEFETRRFSGVEARSPIIIVVDNDDGPREPGGVFSIIKKITHKDVKGDEKFIHIIRNLYLVAIPLVQGKSELEIEDLFDETVRSIKLGEKRFRSKSPSKQKQDTHNENYYGKEWFATKVIQARADTIDFNGFRPLLSNIMLAIEDYSAKLATENEAN